MKLVKITLMSIALLGILLTNAYASKRQVGGLLIGGSTGAIVGNAVGKNVESTLIGATVGGVLGYAIGNELDHIVLSCGRNVIQDTREGHLRDPHLSYPPQGGAELDVVFRGNTRRPTRL